MRLNPLCAVLVALFATHALRANTETAAIPAPPAALSAATELVRKTVDLGTHTVTYVRITPPQLSALPQAPRPPATEPNAEQLAQEAARAAKIYEQLLFSVTVYPATATTPTVIDLNWWREGRRYQAWSNVDFRLLGQITELETSTHVFAWFPAVGVDAVTDLPADRHPAGLALFDAADPAPHYYVEGTEADLAPVADTLLGLDTLHAYYQIHYTRLVEEHARLQALNAAHAAELARNPPRPVDTVIHFWKAHAAPAPAPASAP